MGARVDQPEQNNIIKIFGRRRDVPAADAGASVYGELPPYART